MDIMDDPRLENPDGAGTFISSNIYQILKVAILILARTNNQRI